MPVRSAAWAQTPRPLPAGEARAAQAFLAGSLGDPNTTDLALASLRLTADPDLVPLFAAYCSHSDRRVRQVAFTALADRKDDRAVAALAERMRSDPVVPIRAQAVAVLNEWKAAAAEDLRSGLQADDESIQYLSARGLVALGQGQTVMDKLAKLTEAKGADTRILARLDLLWLGESGQLDAIAQVLTDSNTAVGVVVLALDRIRENRLAATARVVEQLCSAPNEDIRVRALRAAGAVLPDGPQRIAEALAKADKPAVQVILCRWLAEAGGAPERPLAAVAAGTGLPAALARFELARKALDAGSARAAAEVAAFGHPVVLEHLIDRIREDANRSPEGADVYAPVLLDILRKTPAATGRLRWEQEACARAATLLGDIGGPASLEGLREVVAGPYGEPKRAAIGGLVRTRNPAAAALVRSQLDSPYPELAATSAIALARHGDRESLRALQDILAHVQRYEPSLVTMVAWYSLKLEGRHRAALEELIALNR